MSSLPWLSYPKQGPCLRAMPPAPGPFPLAPRQSGICKCWRLGECCLTALYNLTISVPSSPPFEFGPIPGKLCRCFKGPSPNASSQQLKFRKCRGKLHCHVHRGLSRQQVHIAWSYEHIFSKSSHRNSQSIALRLPFRHSHLHHLDESSHRPALEFRGMAFGIQSFVANQIASLPTSSFEARSNEPSTMMLCMPLRSGRDRFDPRTLEFRCAARAGGTPLASGAQSP